MVKFHPKALQRGVAVTIQLVYGHATFSHEAAPRNMTAGQLLEWVSRARNHRAPDYLYVLRDAMTGQLLSDDETLGQLGRRHGGHVRLQLHIDPQMA